MKLTSYRSSLLGWTLLLGLFSAGAAVMAPGEAAGQNCNRNCPPSQRDASGCCRGSGPVVGPVVKPTAPPAPPTAETCKDGREVSSDTHGKCCWPGQVVSGGQCVGTPSSCPPGREVAGAECKLTSCPDGQTHVDNLHCCWPGQGWSSQQAVCKGTPRCPRGSEPFEEDCVPLDRDGDGIPNAKDKCPTQAEDKDGFQDDDGCPDPDNDGDGIPDFQDRCPNQPEDMNGFQDDDGCPDAAEAAVALREQKRVREELADRERKRTKAEKEAKEESERKEAEDRRTEARKAAVLATVARERKERQARQAENLESRQATLRTLGTVSYVASGLFLASGAGFGVAAALKKGDLDGCVDKRCPQGLSGDLDSARANATRSTFLFILGGATFATGLTLRIIADNQKLDDDLAWSLQLSPFGAGLERRF